MPNNIIKLTVPSWLVYKDENGKFQAELEFGGELTRNDLEFIGYEILGNPSFTDKVNAIQYIRDLIE